jgi:hypothetical protein
MTSIMQAPSRVGSIHIPANRIFLALMLGASAWKAFIASAADAPTAGL